MTLSIFRSWTYADLQCRCIHLFTDPFWMFLLPGSEDHFLWCFPPHLPAQFLQWHAGHHQTICRELREGSQRSWPGATGTRAELCSQNCVSLLLANSGSCCVLLVCVILLSGNKFCIDTYRLRTNLEWLQANLIHLLQCLKQKKCSLASMMSLD